MTAAVTLATLGNGPVFSAYSNVTQSIVTNTFVKLQVNVEEFDTNNCYDSTTNYRFTPTVAGYYQINGQIGFGTWLAGGEISIFKNGAQFKNGSNTNNTAWATVSTIIYLNGTTDYVELYIAHLAGSTQITSATSAQNYFSGALIRGA